MAGKLRSPGPGLSLRSVSTQFVIPSHRLTAEPVLRVLDSATRPLSSSEIAKEIGARGAQVGAILANLRKSGVAIKLGERRPFLWIGGEGILKAAADGFPGVIAYYRLVDPRTADLLEHDWIHFRDRLEGHSTYTI